MDNPCAKCLVRSVCRNKVIKKRHDTSYLIMSYIEKCPEILKYFGSHPDGQIIHTYEKIFKLCKIHGASSFIWNDYYDNVTSMCDTKKYNEMIKDIKKYANDNIP